MEKEPVAIVKVCDFLGDIIGCGHLVVKEVTQEVWMTETRAKGRALWAILTEWAEDEEPGEGQLALQSRSGGGGTSGGLAVPGATEGFQSCVLKLSVAQPEGQLVLVWQPRWKGREGSASEGGGALSRRQEEPAAAEGAGTRPGTRRARSQGYRWPSLGIGLVGGART